MQEDVQLLTYDEISAAFSINRESARHLVLRKRWARRKGNDGKARVEVPIDALESAHVNGDLAQDAADNTGDNTGAGPRDDTGDSTCTIAVLARHIERLEGELKAAKEELAVARLERDAQREQATTLKVALECELRSSAELRQERDRWHAAAVAPRGLWAWLTARSGRMAGK